MMRIQDTIDSFIKQQGVSFQLENSSQINFGILSPNNSHNNAFLQNQISRAGTNMNGDFILLISMKTTNIKKNCKLRMTDKTFYVKSIDTFYLSNMPLHQWAILSPINQEVMT